MDKLQLEIEIPHSVYQKLETFIFETVDRAFTEKARSISKERIKLTRDEAAKMLRVSLPTLDKMRSEGKIKTEQFGKRILIPQEEIDKILNIPIRSQSKPAY